MRLYNHKRMHAAILLIHANCAHAPGIINLKSRSMLSAPGKSQLAVHSTVGCIQGQNHHIQIAMHGTKKCLLEASAEELRIVPRRPCIHARESSGSSRPSVMPWWMQWSVLSIKRQKTYLMKCNTRTYQIGSQLWCVVRCNLTILLFPHKSGFEMDSLSCAG